MVKTTGHKNDYNILHGNIILVIKGKKFVMPACPENIKLLEEHRFHLGPKYPCARINGEIKYLHRIIGGVQKDERVKVQQMNKYKNCYVFDCVQEHLYENVGIYRLVNHNKKPCYRVTDPNGRTQFILISAWGEEKAKELAQDIASTPCMNPYSNRKLKRYTNEMEVNLKKERFRKRRKILNDNN